MTYAEADGGLICEKRAGRARSTLWRITADGRVLPDTPYSYEQRAFVAGAPVLGHVADAGSRRAQTDGRVGTVVGSDHVSAAHQELGWTRAVDGRRFVVELQRRR